MLQYQKATIKNADDKKVNYRFLSGFLVTFTTAIALSIKNAEDKNVNYRFISGFLVTFTTAIAFFGKVSFAMP